MVLRRTEKTLIRYDNQTDQTQKTIIDRYKTKSVAESHAGSPSGCERARRFVRSPREVIHVVVIKT